MSKKAVPKDPDVTQEEAAEAAPQTVTKSIKEKLENFHEKTLEELKIDEMNLFDEFGGQPAKFYMASARFTKASKIYDQEKQKLEEIVAEKYMELKLGAEKTTEAYLEKASKYCPEARAQKQKVIDAEYQMNFYKSIETAMIHRRDMLIQMGSTARAEFTGQVGINKQGLEDDDMPRTKNGRPTSL